MKQTLQVVTISALSLFSLGAYAQNQPLVASWEAEDFVGWGYKPDNSNFPYVKSEGHSGGHYIQRISKSNSVVYLVNVDEAGTYDLKMHYMIKGDGGQIGSTISVWVNDQERGITTVQDYTAEDTSVETKSITYQVYLDAGVNTIRIGRNRGLPGTEGIDWKPYTPNFDRFELFKSVSEITKPATDKNHADNVGVTTFSGLDGYTALQSVMQDKTLFTLAAESGNETVGNLVDFDPSTKFVSTAEEETLVLHFPDGIASGYALRNLVFDTKEVIVESYSIQRSKDGKTWEDIPADSRFISLYYDNAGTAIGEWKTGFNDDKYEERYYRFTIKRIPGLDKMEIGEMKIYALYQGFADLTNAENGTISSIKEGEVKVDKPSSNAIDDNVGSKFSLFDTQTLDLTYAFNEYAHVTAYSIANAVGPADRDPKSWILEASNDNEKFIELDKVEGYAWYHEKRCQDVRILPNNQNAYKYYRLTVTENNGGTMVHLSEFQLFGVLEKNPGEVTTKQNELWDAPVAVYPEDNVLVFENPVNNEVHYSVFDVTGKLQKAGCFTSLRERVAVGQGLFIVHLSADSKSKALKLYVE